MKKKFLLGLTLIILFISLTAIVFISKRNPLGLQENKKEYIEKVHLLEYADSPADNPLKGFVGYQGTGNYSDFPVSLEYIAIPLSEIVTGENKYDWSKLEENLNEVASYGRQSIVSFYMDIPGNDIGKDAIPSYLLDEGLKVHKYTLFSYLRNKEEVGYSPDYSDKDLWKMIYSFVDEFGKKYDGDVRIAQIEASIVGIWGEWHTDVYDFGLKDSKLIELAKVYDTSFNQTQISCRYPKKGMEELKVGYSDYSFCYESIIDDWSQLERLKSLNLSDYWKVNMGGGELMPTYVKDIFAEEDWGIKEGESFEECCQALHPSWLLVGSLNDFSSEERENAIEAASLLGYDFTVTQAVYSEQIESSVEQMELGISVKNIGIAPFYYNWDSELILLDKNENEVYREKTGWDLTKIQSDNKEYEFIHNISLADLEEGTYTILYQVINPQTGGYNLRFANKTQQRNGQLILGKFTIGNSKPENSAYSLEIDSAQDLMNKYNLQVTSKYINDKISIGEDYLLGVRIRNSGNQYVEGINGIQIKVYYNNNCIDSILTDWKTEKIKPEDSNYFAWNLGLKEKGTYNLRLQFLPGTEEIEIGSIVVE